MTISNIRIENIKGIEEKCFEIELVPNKPNLLVAPNGFGKSSIATAFASMNTKLMKLADKDRYEENSSHSPILSLDFDGRTLVCDEQKNEIRSKFEVTVIRSGLIPKATKRNMGKFTSATASMEVRTIEICPIPKLVRFGYAFNQRKDEFGENGKILPNITGLLKDSRVCMVLVGHELGSQCKKPKANHLSNIISDINQQNGNSENIRQWITQNQLEKWREINPLESLSLKLKELDLAKTETEAFLIAYQIFRLYADDPTSFGNALKWLQYTAVKKNLMRSYYQTSKAQNGDGLN